MQDWLADRARATPDATALIDAGTDERWTFAELDRDVERVAGRLAALGIGAGDHLVSLLGSRVASVRLVHAAMRLGAVLAPLGDRLAAPEARERIDRADATAVVCGADTEAVAVEAVAGGAAGDGSTRDVPVASVDDPEREGVTGLSSVESAADAERETAAFDAADWRLGDTQLLLFTSGTTGTPKAVRLTTGNLLASAVASAFRLGLLPGDRWLVALSIHHTGGITPVLRMALSGTTVVLRESFEAGPTADDLAAYEVTGVSLVPTMLSRMLDARGTLADSLRTVLLGGAPATRELIERCRNYSVPVHPTYGMTETASQIATARPAEAFENPETVGRPLFWTDLTVRDEAGAELAPGETGELVVAGPTVTPGYYGDDAATEAAFGAGGLRTGDVGYRDEAGRVYVLDRKDDRILTGGETVDPGEVVAALREHPGVADAAVVGLPDEEWGQRVAALVVPADPGAAGADRAGTDADAGAAERLDADAVEAFCRERLAGYKLPRVIAFADALPRTASGTVERPAVVERLAAVRADDDGSDGER